MSKPISKGDLVMIARPPYFLALLGRVDMKSRPGRAIHLRADRTKNETAGKRNPAGSKIARQFAKHAGIEWKGEVFHGGELTKLNRERAYRRLPMSLRAAA